MKTLTHTIIALVVLSILAADFAPAQTSQPAAPVIPSVPSPSPAPPMPTPPPTIPASVSDVNNVIYNLTKAISLGSRSGSDGTVLVIPSEQTSTEDLIKINEDMNVMSRIFEKNLEQDRITTVTSSIFVSRRDLILPLLGGGRSEIQSMYLQGFGALFLLKVDFPLSPPPDVQEEEKEIQKTEEGDPVWQQIRQEMYEPDKVDRRHRTDRPESKYDAEKVENLKTSLIKTLKHAVNIRNLKPNESAILTVIGSGGSTGTTITSARMLPGENQIIISEQVADGKMITKVVPGTSLDNIGLSSLAILVIRTKRSDIDEFAKGDLDFDQFRQRVQMFTYPLLGGADGHGSHFNPYMQFRSTGSSSARR